MRHMRYSLIAFAGLFMLGACSGNVKQSLGLKKQAPDEFKVVANQPLSVPPDFRLVKPVPGAKRPQVSDLDEQAEAALFGRDLQQPSSFSQGVETSALESRGESALLSRAGAFDADPNIRDLLNEEERVEEVQEEEKGFFSTFIDYTRGVDNEPPALDATAEKKRIAKAQQSGEEIKGDDAVLQEKKDRGLLGRLFD